MLVFPEQDEAYGMLSRSATATSADQEVDAEPNAELSQFNGLGPGRNGVTHVRVLIYEAKGLPPKDLSGFSDPYVKVRLGGTKLKTKVVRQSFHPHWNQE